MNETEKFDDYDYTDCGLAKMFTKKYKNKVIYVKERGWMVWNGQVWKENPHEVKRLAQAMIDELDARRETSRA